jgi:hypothetical protein
MDRARSNDDGAAKRVPNEHDGPSAVLLQRGDPSQNIQGTFGQHVGVPVVQPQGHDPLLAQRFRQPHIRALPRPTEAPAGATHPDHPVPRLQRRMQNRVNRAPVRLQ